MLLWKLILPAQWYFSLAKNLQGCAGCVLPGVKVPDAFGLLSPTSDWRKGGNCRPLQALGHPFCKFAIERIENIISVLPGARSERLLPGRWKQWHYLLWIVPKFRPCSLCLGSRRSPELGFHSEDDPGTARSAGRIPPREAERRSAGDDKGSSSAPGKPERPRFSEAHPPLASERPNGPGGRRVPTACG